MTLFSISFSESSIFITFFFFFLRERNGSQWIGNKSERKRPSHARWKPCSRGRERVRFGFLLLALSGGGGGAGVPAKL